jgi:hypothetical protein
MKDFIKFFAASSDLNKIPTSQVNIPKVTLDSSQLVNILNTVYFWVGIIAVIVIVGAGFTYITAFGDANKIKTAKNIILYAVVGLVIIISASLITQFIYNGVTNGAS